MRIQLGMVVWLSVRPWVVLFNYIRKATGKPDILVGATNCEDTCVESHNWNNERTENWPKTPFPECNTWGKYCPGNKYELPLIQSSKTPSLVRLKKAWVAQHTPVYCESIRQARFSLPPSCLLPHPPCLLLLLLAKTTNPSIKVGN